VAEKSTFFQVPSREKGGMLIAGWVCMHPVVEDTTMFRSTPLALFALLMTLPAAAAAQSECALDSDCPSGFVCQLITEPCPTAPACPPDMICDPVVCDPITYGQCEPGPCASDADCGADMRCETFTYTQCSAGGSTATPCVDGEPCPPPPDPTPTTCTDVSESYCVPAWLRICTADSDCDANFTCIQPETCACSGTATGGTTTGGTDPNAGSSGGSSGSGGATDTPPPDTTTDPNATTTTDSCVCEPAGDALCIPQDISCTADAECPAGWTCQQYTSDVTGACAVDSTGTTVCDPPPATTTAGSCVPPLWDAMAGGASPRDVAATQGSGANDGTTTGGEAAPTANNGDYSGTGSNGTRATAGGCAAATPSIWVVLGLLALWTRRRRS